MPFFSRPDLSNEQFKQNIGSELTLSGQTHIATPSGLTLSDGIGGNVPIIATGGTDNMVMTYIGGKILLAPSSASGGTGVYSGASPTTCTVGGLVSGSAILGCSISSILQDILVPVLYPTLTQPYSTFSISPSTLLYEVGTVISPIGTSTLNRGGISPSYGTSGYLSGIATCYEFNAWGSVITSLNNQYTFSNHIITNGSNSLSGKVCYDQGEQPKDSSGNNYSTPLPSGSTTPNNITISGIYPYFYGKYPSGGAAIGLNRPAPTDALIVSGNKVVQNSSGTLSINFGATSDDYLWFAIPTLSTSKTKWYFDALNNGVIGGGVSAGGNLFPDYNSISNVGTTCWNNQTYKLYISNYQSATNGAMELRNI